jgi:acyl-CoA reductase-like NAD-dependent aldehyde dehydrogenase
VRARSEAPTERFNVVTGLSSTVGAELVRNPDVAKISFRGSVAVGQQIMRERAATMKRVTLELGGKSPNILLDDVNLDEAIPRALALAFLNSGKHVRRRRGFLFRAAGLGRSNSESWLSWPTRAQFWSG